VSSGNGTRVVSELCNGLVKKYLGKLSVEIEFGKGSRFVFTLPVN
jgi:signal transduction histidine kinase